MGGMRIQMTDEVHVEVNLRKHRWVVLGKYTLNSYLTWTTITGKGAEDICLTLKGRGSELKGAQCNPRGDKGNLVLNKEEKKNEWQNGHSFRIKCTATT